MKQKVHVELHEKTRKNKKTSMDAMTILNKRTSQMVTVKLELRTKHKGNARWRIQWCHKKYLVKSSTYCFLSTSSYSPPQLESSVVDGGRDFAFVCVLFVFFMTYKKLSRKHTISLSFYQYSSQMYTYWDCFVIMQMFTIVRTHMIVRNNI